MNKAIINDEIVIAYDVLKKSEIDIWCGCDHGKSDTGSGVFLGPGRFQCKKTVYNGCDS